MFRHDDRTIDEHRIFDHCVKNLVFTDIPFVKAKFVEQRLFLSDDISDRKVHTGDQVFEFVPRRRSLQVFDNARLMAGGANAASALRDVPQPGL